MPGVSSMTTLAYAGCTSLRNASQAYTTSGRTWKKFRSWLARAAPCFVLIFSHCSGVPTKVTVTVSGGRSCRGRCSGAGAAAGAAATEAAATSGPWWGNTMVWPVRCNQPLAGRVTDFAASFKVQTYMRWVAIKYCSASVKVGRWAGVPPSSTPAAKDIGGGLPSRT